MAHSSVAPLQASGGMVPFHGHSPYCRTAPVRTQSGSIQAITLAPRILGCRVLANRSPRKDLCVFLASS